MGLRDTYAYAIQTAKGKFHGERPREPGERLVLRLGEGHVVGALQLDADGEVVAALAALPLGSTRVPGPQLGRHVLDELAVAPDEEMRGDGEPLDFPEEGMRLGIEPAEEEVVDPRAAEKSRRQRDVVDHDERDLLALGALVAMGRRHPARAGAHPGDVEEINQSIPSRSRR